MLPDRSLLIRQKLVENANIEKKNVKFRASSRKKKTLKILTGRVDYCSGNPVYSVGYSDYAFKDVDFTQ